MLVLTRKTQQQIQIGNNITITIVRVTGQSVRVGIQAPEEVRVIRGELAGKPMKADVELTVTDSAPALSVDPPVSASKAGAAPLAARCRNRLPMPAVSSSPATSPLQPTACVENRCRAAGASTTTLIRRPQRLGPASLGSILRTR